MQTSKFKGTGVAIVTPFLNDQNIDFKSLGKIVNHIIDNKVEYIVALGTTGESVTLSGNEKQAILNHIAEVNNKRLPLVVGIGGNNTREVVNQIKSTDLSHADAILSVCPYYNKPNQNGIFEHYKTIASETSLPIIIYNVPGRTGINITAETTIKLTHQVKNIIATKEASCNFNQIMEIIKNKPKDFLVISGDDATTLPLLACGGDGVISVVANALPKEFSDMVRFAMSNKMDEARAIHYHLLEFINTLFADGSPGGIKAAMSIQGLLQNNLRLPLVPVNQAVYDKLKKLLQAPTP
jgi:4-hydroxy-tetrahydrodipicolinate synthase